MTVARPLRVGQQMLFTVFFGSGGKPIEKEELYDFWLSLTDAERMYYLTAIFESWDWLMDLTR